MLDEVEVSWEDYEESLAISTQGMDMILQRDITEMMVNSYNPLWMRALNAATIKTTDNEDILPFKRPGRTLCHL